MANFEHLRHDRPLAPAFAGLLADHRKFQVGANQDYFDTEHGNLPRYVPEHAEDDDHPYHPVDLSRFPAHFEQHPKRTEILGLINTHSAQGTTAAHYLQFCEQLEHVSELLPPEMLARRQSPRPWHDVYSDFLEETQNIVQSHRKMPSRFLVAVGLGDFFDQTLSGVWRTELQLYAFHQAVMTALEHYEAPPHTHTSLQVILRDDKMSPDMCSFVRAQYGYDCAPKNWSFAKHLDIFSYPVDVFAPGLDDRVLEELLATAISVPLGLFRLHLWPISWHILKNRRSRTSTSALETMVWHRVEVAGRFAKSIPRSIPQAESQDHIMNEAIRSVTGAALCHWIWSEEDSRRAHLEAMTAESHDLTPSGKLRLITALDGDEWSLLK